MLGKRRGKEKQRGEGGGNMAGWKGEGRQEREGEGR